MKQRTRDRSLGEGVYFERHDYVGFGPRFVIFIIDSLVLAALIWLIAFFWENTVGEYTGMFSAFLLFAVWFYLVPLKRSKVRTIGYRLMGCKLVTLKGTRPSLFMMTFRSLLWMFGPFHFLLDVIWCGIDDDRQTMRDRFSNMCLVRSNAEPIGTGEVHLAYLYAFGYSLAYPRVVHPKTGALH
jgi:uncharacterized RDD family membrane protein YckC